MVFFQEGKFSWLEKICINILKCGPIPKHVAFIMDGNRRFAEKNGSPKGGLYFAREKFKEATQWCRKFGINEVTGYAFSIENFKRSAEEVSRVMDILIEMFTTILSEKEAIEELGLCVRIFGDITLLPIDLQMLVAEIVLFTRNNTKMHLNVCLAYTSREEIANAVKEIASGFLNKNLKLIDVNEKLLNSTLYSSRSTDPDIIIRTSGEIRLSDFMLWQGCYSALFFVDALWPELTMWNFFAVILHYQRFHEKLKDVKEKHERKIQYLEEQDNITYAREVVDNMNASNGEGRIAKVYEVLDEMVIRKRNFIKQLDDDYHRRLVKIKNGETVQNVAPVPID